MSAAFEIGVPSRPAAAAQPEPRCAHCALPVPVARLDRSQSAQFCCDGCRAVFAILHDAGLQDYYAKREASDRRKLAPEPSSRKFEELDEPEFRKSHCRERADGSLQSEFFVEGVHCSACVWLLERLPRVAPAVLQARYDSTRSMLSITWDPAAAQLSEIARALAALGYVPHPTHSTTLAAEQRRADRAL
ncbi:MAG TPA: heavy metal translocating P-type ATPase metal-binding domain-containing protein, partial [Polyangiaceae bacterium]|nr:heavy metal translocating P-type ATPase metal-binding domain-containing protein [Polyangiaceae bacterium]